MLTRNHSTWEFSDSKSKAWYYILANDDSPLKYSLSDIIPKMHHTTNTRYKPDTLKISDKCSSGEGVYAYYSVFFHPQMQIFLLNRFFRERNQMSSPASNRVKDVCSLSRVLLLEHPFMCLWTNVTNTLWHFIFQSNVSRLPETKYYLQVCCLLQYYFE